MVPMLAAWHEHHGPVFAEIDRRVSQGEPMVLAGHALAETYAVLTRLPPPRRVAPSQALRTIEATFVRGAGRHCWPCSGAPRRWVQRVGASTTRSSPPAPSRPASRRC